MSGQTSTITNEKKKKGKAKALGKYEKKEKKIFW